MTGNKTQRQWIGLSYRFATMLIALLFVATGKVNAQTAYYSFDGSTMTIYYGEQIPSGCKAVGAWDAPSWISSPLQSDKQKNATKVIFDSSFKNATPTSCKQWFYRFSKLESIDGIENLNTEEVTDMESMFSECGKLKSIDLSHFNTTKVKNMDHMFNYCSSLATIDASSFNTSEVTNMDGMFAYCSAAGSINVSSFNTANVTTMTGMFGGCLFLSAIDLTHFNTAMVKSMNSMFTACISLQNLDLTSFNTKLVENMSNMFSYCSALKTIYASENFNVSNVTESKEMFDYCNNLVGVIPYDATKLDKEWANNVTGYFMPYYQINDTKYPALGDKVVLHLEDENTFEAQSPFNINEGSYTRHGMKSDWGTVCVPFVINTEDASTNCTFYQLNNISNDAIEISQINDASIEAGVPVIVKRNEGVTDLYVAAVKDDTKGTGVVTAPQNGTATNHLEGTFINQKVSKKCYFLAKNKFWYVGQIAEDGEIKGVHVYPFRAYLTCADDAQQTNSLNIVVKDETNSVENHMTVDSLFSDKAEYYDAAGRRIQTLQKGLNIVRVGGQTRKVMIK